MQKYLIRIGKVNLKQTISNNVVEQSHGQQINFLAAALDISDKEAEEIIIFMESHNNNYAACDYVILPLTHKQLAQYTIDRQLGDINTFWKYPHVLNEREAKEHNRFFFPTETDLGSTKATINDYQILKGESGFTATPYFNQLENNMTNVNTKMKNTAAFINEALTTIAVSFNLLAGIDNNGRTYTYKVTKEFALQLKEDILVLAEGDPNKPFQVVRVVEIHEESEIDVDADFEYKFAFQVIHVEDLTSLKTEEKVRVSDLQRTQRAHMRRVAREQINSSLAIAEHTENGVKKL